MDTWMKIFITLIFMIRCQNYKKIIIYGNVSLVITFWAFILIAYITWKPISTFLCQFYPDDLANFAGSTIVFFINAALIIRWFDQIVALPWVMWAAPPIANYFGLIFLSQIYVCLVHWDICAFLGNCSWEFPQNFFIIE